MRGFTLVELLVVMGIILILVSIAIPAANIARNKARDTEVKAGCNQIQAALEQFAVTHTGFYPGAHWVEDTSGNFEVGPGVIGGLPTYDAGGDAHKDFYVARDSGDARGPNSESPYYADGTPNPNVLDALVVEGYLPDYPANPFLKTTDAGKAQMGNLFLFDPILGDTTPVVGRYDTLDWNRYTNVIPSDDASSASITTMRKTYLDFGRGHFSYIPLNPVNNTGFDYVALWTDPALTDADRSGYYKHCRGYILAGWGYSRLNDAQAKGLSEKYWNGTLGAFDFDNSLIADPLEQVISAGTLIEPEMRDRANSSGAFGGTLLGGGVDIDQAFYGATFLKITGS